jgi:subtilisin family serine protease
MRKLHKSSYYRILAILLVTAMLGGLLPFTPTASAQTAPAPQPNQSSQGINSPEVSVEPGSAVAAVSANLDNATGRTPVMLQLVDEPAALIYAQAKQQSGDGPQLASATRNQISKINAAQTNVLNELNRLNLKDTQVIFRVDKAYNGIALYTDAGNIASLAKLPGVKKVTRLETHERDHSTSVPFIGTPTAWQSFGITGTNVKIGIIDTGIDYFHTNFGGPGTVRTLFNDPNDKVITDTPGLFPGPKVAGGYDFAGDTYNADATSPTYSPTARPDIDPVDCPSALGGGHGSHVAGSAAGLGVNANGTTYTGPYDATVPFNTMRIGPGVAPGATLYALRVFGCQGSTNLTIQAINWALDPNGDQDMSDKLDIVNQSLGSAFGTPDSASAEATQNAAIAGIFMANSAGNNSDASYISSSPGSAVRALTVASSVDASTVTDGFRVNSPPSLAGPHPASFSSAFPWAITTTVPITLDLVYIPSNADGCTAFTPAQVSGKAVLVDWAPAGTSNFVCGSAARANNAAAAGAKGIIMRSGQNYLDTAIAGNSLIPAVFTILSVGEALKTALQAGAVSVTFSYEYAATQTILAPQFNDTISDFTSRGPQGAGNFLKPDLAAPGQTIFSADSGTGNKGTSKNGTSMATPHMAGVIALLKQQRPSWNNEELKALVMNTAVNDLFTGQNQTGLRYSPVRVGSGRVDVARAVTNTVVAYNADTVGAVSVSFGAVRFIGTQSYTKTVKVSNKGNASVTYNIAYNSYNDQPGVDYTFPDGNSITVPANSSATFRVVLTGDSAAMKSIIDPTQVRTVPPASATDTLIARQWMSEETGNIVLTPTTPGTALRVPVYASVRPASDIAASQSSVNAPSVTGVFTTNLTLQGTGLNTGSSYPTDTLGVTTAFELAHTSPTETLPVGFPEGTRHADLKYVGIRSNAPFVSTPVTNSTVYFAIATHQDWTTAATEATFVIDFDFNNDGAADAYLQNFRRTVSNNQTDILTGFYGPNKASGSGFLPSYLNSLSPTQTNTAIFNNNVMFIPLSVSFFGLTNQYVANNSTAFKFKVTSSSRFFGQVDTTPWIGYDFMKPGVSTALVGYPSLTTTSIPVRIKASDLVKNSGGVLLLHHHNVAGKTTQVVPIDNTICGPDAALVTKTSDDAQCGSLSYAVNWAQSTGVTNPQVIFKVPGDVYTLTSPIVITQPTQAGKEITIDGGVTTSNGFGVASTVLTASGTVSNAMVVLANNVTVKGFQIRGFSEYAVESWADNATFAAMYLYGNGGGIKLGTANDAATNTRLGIAGDKSSSNFIYQNTGPGVLVDTGTATANWLYAGYRLDGSKAANAVGVRVNVGGKLTFGFNNRIAS